MNVVDSLKSVAAKLLKKTANDIPGDNKCEVLDYLAKNYTPPTSPSYTLPAATKSALGGVKQAARVNEAAGENVTKAEFKALLDALKASGQMASS